MVSLLTLFSAAFLAATLIPAQSEAVLAAMVIAKTQPVWLLLAVATSGNVLGSVLNWVLGGFLMRFADRRWFPVSKAHVVRAENWYRRWGYWSLLGAWLPIVGDPLTLVAGVMREPVWRFLLLVTLSKGARYVLVASLAAGWG